MKQKVAVGLACLGALFSSAAAFAIPINPNQYSLPTDPKTLVLTNTISPDDAANNNNNTPSHVAVGGTLLMDARLGHASLANGGTTPSETYVFASVTGVDSTALAAKAPPLDLALVIDRSGSMKGQRMANAMAAAVGAVDRMRDGDSVLVVSFDTEAQVVQPPTIISGETRALITNAIRSIRLGGDTCISCGLEEAKRALDRAPTGPDRVRRMMLLSDGATNHGIRDVAGLRILASLIREHNCPITTIGVDLDFDEKVMGAIASESNGNHYFVANADGLQAVFNQEFESLVATIAGDAEIVVEPAPGVEVDEVFERAFRRDGRRIIVPLGSFSTKSERSLLMKLRVPVDHDGKQPVADLKLTYRDLIDHKDAAFTGGLSVAVKSDGTAQKEMDPFVQARIERSRTAQTLLEASDLINSGHADEAKARLVGRTTDLGSAQAVARHNFKAGGAAPTRARSFGQDFDDQASALEKATDAANAAASAKKPDAPQTKSAPKILQQLDRSDAFR